MAEMFSQIVFFTSTGEFFIGMSWKQGGLRAVKVFSSLAFWGSCTLHILRPSRTSLRLSHYSRPAEVIILDSKDDARCIYIYVYMYIKIIEQSGKWEFMVIQVIQYLMIAV